MEPVRFCKQYYRQEKVVIDSCACSCIFHTFVLLLLAFLWGAVPDDLSKIHLELDFGTDTSAEVVLETQLIAISEEIQKKIDSVERTEFDSTLVNNDINEPLIAISNPIEETIPRIPDIPVSAEYLSAVVIETEGTSSSAQIDHEGVLEGLIQGVEAGVRNNNIAMAAAGNGDVDSRLKMAGAKTGDVQISLSWNTIDDIDLHVKFTPGNGLVDNINWANRIGRLSNGILDIDMNAHSGMVSATPVENVFWPPGSSPRGVFTVYVHFFRSWSGATQVPVLVRIKNGNDIEFLKVVAQLYANPQQVKQFTYPPHQKTKF